MKILTLFFVSLCLVLPSIGNADQHDISILLDDTFDPKQDVKYCIAPKDNEKIISKSDSCGSKMREISNEEFEDENHIFELRKGDNFCRGINSVTGYVIYYISLEEDIHRHKSGCSNAKDIKMTKNEFCFDDTIYSGYKEVCSKTKEDLLQDKVYDLLMNHYTYEYKTSNDDFLSYYGVRAFAACFKWQNVENDLKNSRTSYTGPFAYGWRTDDYTLEGNKKYAMKRCLEETWNDCECYFVDINGENVIELPESFLTENITQPTTEVVKLEPEKTSTTNKQDEKLNKLQSWYEKGLISKEEYDQKRKKLLGESSITEIEDIEEIKDQVIAKIIGIYEGYLIYPNGDKLPVTTQVYLNNSNILEGKYSFHDFGGELLKGKLNNFEIKSKNNLSIQWIDSYGRGWLEVILSNKSFEGKFGVKDNNKFEKIGNWQGEKISNKDNTETDYEKKLIKLKSLFEKDLITKEEYDEKRKELLRGTSTP